MPHFNYYQHRIFYRQQGEGPLLLILPGNTAASICHQDEIDYFSKRYCAVSLDFLGTGNSDRLAIWPKDWWAKGADQVQALITHLGYDKALVIGTSGGAVVALLLAIHFPQHVRGVIADSTIERFAPEILQRNVIEGRSQPTSEQIQFWSFVHGDDWEQVVDADTTLLHQLAKQGGDWLGGRLNEIQCPVLLTASLEDEFLPDIVSQLTSMARQIPECCIFLTNSGGHPLMWTQSLVFRRVADSFLRGFSETQQELTF